MRKYLLLGLLISTGISRTFAQDGFTPQAGLTYDVVDRNGRTFVNPAPDVAGTPFLKEAWKLGSVVINTNRRFDSVKLRINAYSQEVHFQDRNNNEMALAKGYVRQVNLSPDIPGAPGLRYQNGFPPVDEQDVYNFYQVLAEGKLSLLLSTRKVIAQQKDEMSGEDKKEYRAYEDYYLYDGKTMQRVKKDKATVGGKEIKFKSIGDLKKAIDDFNAL
jgi:hypothetical protein